MKKVVSAAVVLVALAFVFIMYGTRADAQYKRGGSKGRAPGKER